MLPALSERLLACCRYVRTGDRVADIGCDHGYLGIYLLNNHIASSVIAADVNEMPLRSAMQNAEKYAVQDRIAFYLSDGVQKIPRDFDALVCAGMGADTMISILQAAPWLRKNTYRLILQCQSKTHILRRYLSDQGWVISQENVVRDGRFLYTVMLAQFQPDTPALSQGQCYISPALLEEPSPITAEYYHRICFSLSRAISGRGEQAEDSMAQALRQLQALPHSPDLYWLKEDKS